MKRNFEPKECPVCHKMLKGGLFWHMKTHDLKAEANYKEPVKADVSQEREIKARTREDIPNRKERIPMGARRSSETPPQDGNHYHRINDNWRHDPDRIQKALDGGYDVVPGQKTRTVGTNDDGSSIKGVLMRIPQELYNQDQKAKQEPIDRVEAQIKQGTFERKPEDRPYTPKEGIKIDERLTP